MAVKYFTAMLRREALSETIKPNQNAGREFGSLTKLLEARLIEIKGQEKHNESQVRTKLYNLQVNCNIPMNMNVYLIYLILNNIKHKLFILSHNK